MEEKILIIDDNKMLTKLLAKKVENTLGLKVDVAFDMNSAKELVKNDYFMAFVDLCLPDAPNGEVVDVILEKNIPAIVLTGSSDGQTRKKFMEKDIIGYIQKDSEGCIDEMLSSIRMLQKNNKTKIILAIANVTLRAEMKKNLNNQLFNVLAAAHGEEALNYLSDNPDTKLVICDATMPVINGEDLLVEIRSKYSKIELGVIMVGDKDDALEARAFRKGVNDYVIRPFQKESLNCRVNNCLDYMQKCVLLDEYSLGKDLLTGLDDYANFEKRFLDYLEDMQENEEMALALIDIDNLATINYELSYDCGDGVIKHTAKKIKDQIRGMDLATKIEDGKFYVVLKNTGHKEALKAFSNIRVNIAKESVLIALDEVDYSISIGVAFGAKASQMQDLLNSAQKALDLAKANGKNRIEVCF
ncbi:diguanylate cyclase response regulator [Campylobacter ornithocola]|uniref:Diguanylate cyclase response regulator n=1 Tax=Campylobacter ornithocola TaxID=1848766 RepID=A0A6M8MY27_9BACT|nr:diguanylate cyclase [Campylobacter ornithocola]OCX42544.1 diguanylate cyclase response regulator [Campylobacter ornithocola]QKF57257.1 bile resistance regulator [Campylobacter ornithocola]